MAREQYRHSAYWYAYRYGWTCSEAKTYAGEYLDIHSFRLRMRKGTRAGWRGGEPVCRPEEEWSGKEWMKWRNAPKQLDSDFNPFMLGVCIAMDIGVAMRETVKTVTDPRKREFMKRELLRDLRIVRRPFYYARETERRRRLAAERRKINRRSTTAPMPAPDEIMEAWKARKESRAAMVVLGGMLHDLECYVDNCLRFDGFGNVVGRNGGIRGWLKENVPDLIPHYKTLMRYKAIAVRLRQATDTRDPTPTYSLLKATPLHKVVQDVVAVDDPVFDHLFVDLENMISPNTVLGKIPTGREAQKPPTVRRSTARKKPPG